MDDRSARPGMAPSDWHARAVNDVANDRLGHPELTGLEKRLTQYSVSQDRHGQRFDVVRNDEITARDQGQALGRPVQRQGPASAHADVQVLASPGHVNDVQQVLRDGVIDPDLSHSLLKAKHILGRQHRVQRLHRLSVPMIDQQLAAPRIGSDIPFAAGS